LHRGYNDTLWAFCCFVNNVAKEIKIELELCKFTQSAEGKRVADAGIATDERTFEGVSTCERVFDRFTIIRIV
jgi:hypothetical protein